MKLIHQKHLRVLVSIALLAVMLASAAAPALADTAQLTSTQNFLDYLDLRDIKYTLTGMDGNSEVVRVSFTLDNFSSLRCSLFFKDDGEEVSLRVWEIVSATAGKSYILSTLNTLNSDYKFAKFVLDESDNTVQAELDMYIDADHCGRSVYDGMMALFNIIDNSSVAEKLHALE